jgi:hypothetical protein
MRKSYTLRFEKDDVLVEVNSDGEVESASVYCHIFHVDFDCTDLVKNSSAWMDRVNEEFSSMNLEEAERREFDDI